MKFTIKALIKTLVILIIINNNILINIKIQTTINIKTIKTIKMNIVNYINNIQNSSQKTTVIQHIISTN